MDHAKDFFDDHFLNANEKHLDVKQHIKKKNILHQIIVPNHCCTYQIVLMPFYREFDLTLLTRIKEIEKPLTPALTLLLKKRFFCHKKSFNNYYR